jgi:type IV secretory pathway TraG/TraD family ATPase VirD4
MLYVDEFPSFTTEAFANMLPEARKYALSLTLAHQHVSQVDPRIFDAVLGNAGTVIAFRVGAQDAPIIGLQLGDITSLDLTRLPNHRAYVQLMVAGQKSRVFSMQTWPPAIGSKYSDVPGSTTQGG